MLCDLYVNSHTLPSQVNQQLAKLALEHLEARFAKIDANKAPFFVDRFSIATLPCLVCFEDGKAIGKKVGFRGEDSLGDIERYLVECGVLRGVIVADHGEDGEEVKENVKVREEEEEEEEW
jgi:thioredoxin-like negative regulator of GroEL